jgi:TRAP-type transport system small permease protein
MTRVSPLPHPDEQETVTGGGALSVANIIDRAVGITCRAVILLTGIALLVLLTANVVARYLMESGGFRFAQELPERLFPWFIMAGVALAVQHGGHIAVEWLMGKLDRGGKRVVLLAGHALVIFAYLYLCWQSLIVADIVSIEHSPALGLPKTYGYWAIAAGCALLALSTVTVAIRIALIGPEAMPQPSPEEMPT